MQGVQKQICLLSVSSQYFLNVYRFISAPFISITKIILFHSLNKTFNKQQIQILYMLPGKLKEDMYFITSDYVGLNWIHPGEALNL